MLPKVHQRSIKNLLWKHWPQMTCAFFIVYVVNQEWRPKQHQDGKIIDIQNGPDHPNTIERDEEKNSDMIHSVKSNHSFRDIPAFIEPVEYIDYIQDLHNPRVISPHDVQSRSPDAINIGMVMVNPTNKSEFSEEFVESSFISIYNLLKFCGPTPLHFVIGTDKRSASLAGHLLAEIFTKRLSQDMMTRRFWKWRENPTLPDIQVTFANIEEIVAPHKEMIEVIKNHSIQTADGAKEDKYVHNLFYIAPFYHLAFTKLDRILFLDCTDLDFRVDVKKVYDQFDIMSEDEAIGIGNDLSPLYQILLNESGYTQANPDRQLGKPGKFQGLNCGVILFDLKKLRESEIYNSYLSADATLRLVEKYLGGRLRLGEQDWFTSLQYQHPSLFYILPCQYNAQTSVQFLNGPYIEEFPSFHYCDKKENIYIFHANGCGPTPHECKHHGRKENSEKYGGEELAMNINVFWVMMMGVATQDEADLDLTNAFEDLQRGFKYNDPAERKFSDYE